MKDNTNITLKVFGYTVLEVEYNRHRKGQVPKIPLTSEQFNTLIRTIAFLFVTFVCFNNKIPLENITPIIQALIGA